MANVTKFAPYVAETDDVLDHGCGGGYLLKNLRCRKRVGVEVNPNAASTARGNGVELYTNLRDVPDDYVDVAISNHALEHMLHPLLELRQLHPKLRSGGKLVIVVPCEAISSSYWPRDRNHHLYSWSPMCLGNLLTEAGFQVLESEAYIHKWPPAYRQIARLGGRRVFDLACRVYARIERSWFQVRAVGAK